MFSLYKSYNLTCSSPQPLRRHIVKCSADVVCLWPKECGFGFFTYLHLLPTSENRAFWTAITLVKAPHHMPMEARGRYAKVFGKCLKWWGGRRGLVRWLGKYHFALNSGDKRGYDLFFGKLNLFFCDQTESIILVFSNGLQYCRWLSSMPKTARMKMEFWLFSGAWWCTGKKICLL